MASLADFTHQPTQQHTINGRLSKQADLTQAKTILRGILDEQTIASEELLACPFCDSVFGHVPGATRLTFWMELGRAFLTREATR